jgi:glycosyltransferase involved in cell wall biosynthesis
MRVLMLTPYLPYPLLSGGQIRTYNLLKKLAKKHDITLFALIKDQSERQYVSLLEEMGITVKVFKRSATPFTLRNILKTGLSSYPFLVIRNHVPEVVTAVQKELKTYQYDLIHAETFYMMPHIPETTVPKILVEQTIEYLGYESFAQKAPFFIRPLLELDIQKIKRWEQHYWNTCDRLIVMSDEDKQFIEEQVAQSDKIEVVANGVDTTWFSEKKRTQTAAPTVLSVGTFKWLPNVEAVTFLVKKVWPIIQAQSPQARLWIVGNSPTRSVLQLQNSDSQISVTGNIPDIRDAFNQADVLVAPVFSGKGTRYKVLEAMASGTPIVATPTAVEGLKVSHGTHVMISDTADGLARHVLDLFRNPKLRSSLARNGRRFVCENFDWELISAKLDTIYRRIGRTHG